MSETMTKADTSPDRPSFIPVGDRTGTEHITRKDVKMPRLLLAQAMSPEVQESEPAAYIEGLRVGMLFNDLTKEIYGKGPIEFFIVRGDPTHWIEFVPREEGGGVKDPDVPAGDPRTIPDENGRVIATQFYDFIVHMMINGRQEPIALSLKGKAGTRAAKSLNGLVTLRNAPIYAGTYRLVTGMAKSQKGTFAVYLFNNAGWAKSAEELAARKELYDAYKEKEITIERGDRVDEDPDDEATSFDTSKME